MLAVILAGGLGSRLKPFTQVIPKPLLPLGEKSILEIQIKLLQKHGFTDFFLATNYKSEYIESFFGNGSQLGINLTISKETVPLGTCGPLSLLKKQLTEPFLVMNGDILTSIDFKKLFLTGIDDDALLTVVTKEIMLPFQFGNVFHKGKYIVQVEEKPNLKHEIVAGIYILKPEIFNYIPDKQYFGFDNLIKKLIMEQKPILRYLTKSYWIDIGKIDDYNEAEKIYKKHFNSLI